MSDIDVTLKERGARYGEFPEHAFITQELKRTLHDNVNWGGLADDQKEALDMVMHKVGRIINGDPNYIDSWTDIIGYTRLVEKRLIDEQKDVREFAFDSNQATLGAQCQEEVEAERADRWLDAELEKLRAQKGKPLEVNRCSVGEKLTGADPLRKTSSMKSMLEEELRKVFGPDVEIVHIPD